MYRIFNNKRCDFKWEYF